MARVTSKLQVTIPKAIADDYGIAPGAEIEFVAAGDAIRVSPQRRAAVPDAGERLERFDRATERQRSRQAVAQRTPRDGRGWEREDLYARGRAR